MRYKTIDLAKLLGVTTNTIRRYEKNKYTEPVRDGSNYRWYRENDIFKIAIIRLYRKFGFSHNEIREMLDSGSEKTEEALKKRLVLIDKEIERLSLMKNCLENNLNDIVNIRNNGKDFYIENCPELKYVLFSDGEKFLRDKERLDIINRFMYDTPEVFMIQLWDADKLRAGFKGAPPNGWAVKAEFFENIREQLGNTEYIKTYCAGSCLVGVMKKHPKNFDPWDNHSKIAEEFFKKAFCYMDKMSLKPARHPIGIVENSLAKDAYIKVFIPLKEEP